MESLRIDMKGVFKIKKNQKKTSGRRINEYGDEKIIREGDFYKPGIAASPFYGGKLEREKVTADNWSAWLESRHLFKREGPIFLSFTRTTAEPTVMELREELERLVRENIIRSVQFILFQFLKMKMIQSRCHDLDLEWKPRYQRR